MFSRKSSQKYISILLTIALLISVVSSVTLVGRAKTNTDTTTVFLDINSTFDTMDGWNFNNSGKVLSIDHAVDAGHDKNGAMRFTYNEGWAFGETGADVSGVSVMAGTTYKIRYFIKQLNLLGATAYVHIFGYNAEGGGEKLLASAIASKGLDGNSSDDWMEVTGEFTTDIDTSKILIRLVILTDSNWSAPAPGSSILVDDFTVSTEVTAPSMREEFLDFNGTFNTMGGWNFDNSGKVLSIDHTADAGHDKNGAMRFTYNEGWAFGETSADVTGVSVRPSTTYNIRYYLKQAGLLGATAYIHIFGYNAEGGGETLLASGAASKGLDGNSSDDWMEVTGEFTTNADTATVLIRFNVLTDSSWSAPEQGSFALVDDFKISCEIPAEEPSPVKKLDFNGTFEDLSGWSYNNSGKVLEIGHSAEEGYKGSGALKYTYKNGWAFGEAAADIAGVEAEPNTTYQIEYFLKQSGLLGGASYIHIFGYNAEGGGETLLAESVAKRPLDGTVTDDWMQVLGEFTTNADTAKILIRINVLTDPGWNEPASGAYLLIDDLTVFTEKDDEDPSDENGLNGSFDTSLAGWTSLYGGSVLSINWNGNDGNTNKGAMQISYNGGWSSQEMNILTDKIDVSPQTTYSLEYFVKQYGLLGGTAYFFVFGYKSDGTGETVLTAAPIADLGINNNLGDSWAKAYGEFTTGADIEKVALRFTFLTDPGFDEPAADAYFLVDDVAVKEKGTEPEEPLENDGTLDGSFERVYKDSPVNWTIFSASNGLAASSGTESMDGDYSLKFTAGSDKLNSYQMAHSNSVKVEPDTLYELSYYVKNVDLKGATGYASVLKNGTSFIGKEDLARFDVTNGFGTEWKKISVRFNTDEDTESVIIRFTIAMWNESPDIGETLYIDNLTLTKAPVDNSLNLGFESGMHNWTVTPDLYSKIDTDNYHGGAQSLYVRKNDMSESKITSLARIDAKLGQTLLFGGYVKSRNNVNVKIRINLNCYDANGSHIKADSSARVMLGRAVPLNGNSEMSDWMRLMISVPVPDDTVTVGFEIVILEGKTELWIDDLFYRISNISADETLVDFSDFSYVDETGAAEGWTMEKIKGGADFSVQGELPNKYGRLELDSISEAYMVYSTDYLLSGESYNIVFKNYSALKEMQATVKYYDYKGKHIPDLDVTETIAASSTKADHVMTVTVPSSATAKIFFGTSGSGVYTLEKLDIIKIYKPDASKSWLGKWIWYPEDALIEAQYADRYFRHTFTLEDTAEFAPLQISADDNYTVYVNGTEIGSNMGSGQDKWQAPVTYDILRYLKKGENVIAIKAHNLVSYGGLVYDCRITMKNGTTKNVCSGGKDVKVSKTGSDGWTNTGFTDTDWMLPKEIGAMGTSPWGSLYFNSALYAENKIEITSFETDKNIKADSAVEIKAEIKIEEKLKDDFPFEVNIYRKNSTKHITSAVLKIVKGKQPSQWSVGTNKVTFQMSVPDYLTTGNYTLQLSDTYYYLTNEDVIDRQFASISVIGANEKAQLPKSEVKSHNGKPTVFVNGEAKAPLFYLSPAGDLWWSLEKEAKYSETTETEFYVTNCTYLNKNGNKTQPIWVDEDTIDFDTFDRYIYEPLSANPDAMIIVAIGMQAPSWWLDRHPEEEIIIYDSFRDQYSAPATRAVSFSSEAYRKDATAVLEKLVKHMMDAPYASHIAGIKLQDGETQEYMTEGVADWIIGDFSEASLNGFRKYLKETYGTNAALQKAYNDSSVTFENVKIPDWNDRGKVWLSEGGATQTGLLDPATNRLTIDYQYYLGKSATDTMMHYAEAIKKISGDKMLVGAYHGYVWNFATSGAGSTHPAIDKVLASSDVDFICSPFVYGERGIGENAAYDAMLDGVQAAGKLYVLEIDTRSVYEVATGNADWDADVGYCYTMKESVQSLKRDIGGLVAKGAGFWIFNMYGSWWYDDQMLRYINEVKTEMYYNTYLNTESESDIAIFVDEMIYPYVSPNDVYGAYQSLYFLFNQQRRNLGTIGAGYDTYNMSDLVKGNLSKEYKINVMLSPYEITAEEEAAIRSKLMKDGKIIVWVYLPGLSDGKANNLENITDLTGFKVNYYNKRGMQTGVMLPGHELTKGIENFTYGNDLNSPVDSAGPLPYIELEGDSNAVKLAAFGFDNSKAAMALKDMGGWTSVYSTVMNLPSIFWRNLIQYAGGHIWSENMSDIIHASNHYLSVYSMYGGTRTIHLPAGNYSVYDVYNKTYIPVANNRFTFELEENSARLFRLMSEGKIAVLARTSGGHATLDRLGVTEIPNGSDFTVKAELEKGYYLSSVKVNGIIVDTSTKVTLKNVNESTDIVFEVKPVKTYTTPTDPEEKPENPIPPEDGNHHDSSEKGDGGQNQAQEKPDDNPGKETPASIFVTKTEVNWGLIALIVGSAVIIIAVAATLIEVFVVSVRKKKKH